MSESERETHPAGEIATRTPPEGEPAVAPPGERAARGNDGTGEPATAPPGEHAARANGATGQPAADGYRAEPAAAEPRRRRRPRTRPEPVPDQAYTPVVPLDRPSLLQDEPAPARVRIRKLRVFGVLLGLSILAVISTIFGMMMAVTSDLPSLEEPAGRNSELVDRNGESLGMLTGNQKRIFLKSEEIAPVMKQAIIAIEDRRFYTNAGIDLRGIGRALYQEVRAQDAVQGGSTITMQFVKI